MTDAGFQVIVPGLRGYRLSGKPGAVEAYSLPVLAGDVLAILADQEVARTHVAGHDWGAALGRVLASFRPGQDRPPGRPVRREPCHLPPHVRAAANVVVHAAVPIPGVAERWLTDDGRANFRSRAGHPDADQVIAGLKASGSLAPGLNWYPANIPPESWAGAPPQLPPVHAPTMGIWSSGDMALSEVQMTDSAKTSPARGGMSASTAPATGCSSTPARVNQLLLDFLPADPVP